MRRRLMRSEADRMIGGIAGGMAEYFDADAALVRLALLAATLLTGGTLAVLYVAAWIIVPTESKESVLPPG